MQVVYTDKVEGSTPFTPTHNLANPSVVAAAPAYIRFLGGFDSLSQDKTKSFDEANQIERLQRGSIVLGASSSLYAPLVLVIAYLTSNQMGGV